MSGRLLRHRTGLPVGVEKRADGAPVIVGYASVFYSPGDPGTAYRMWDDIEERIMPGAFDRALKEGDDVRGLFNHDASQVLGRTKSGTVRLSVDAKGLRYEIEPPDTQAGRDVVKLIERGDVSASSFGFIPEVTTYREEKREGESSSLYVIERNAVRLFDVSPVTFPAYEGTEAATRELAAKMEEEVRAELLRHFRSLSDEEYGTLVKIRARAIEVELAMSEAESFGE